MVLTLLNVIYNLILILILARVIVSWVRPNMGNPTVETIVRFIYDSTEPLLAPIRNVLPPMGGLDLSPLILLLALGLIRNLAFGLLL